MTDLDQTSPATTAPVVTAEPAPRHTRSTTPTTMRAAVHERYGRPEDVVTVRTVPVPEVGPDDVLVKVGAASVNALDWHYVTGLPMFARPTLGLRRPKRQVPGADVAGVVEAVGAAVTRFQPGDRVFGEVSGGAFAEYLVAPADWLVPVPEGVAHRAGRHHRRRRRDRAPGPARLGPAPGRPAGAGQRRLGRCRQLRGPARQGPGRLARDGGVQHRQRRGGPSSGRRPGGRLHPRGRLARWARRSTCSSTTRAA